MTPSVSAPRNVPVYMAPRIGRPSGFLPRLPSRLPPPSSVHDGVSLLRQVLLWLPPSFLRYLWHSFPATDTAVCVDRRGAGVCPSWRRRRVDHGAWAAVGEGVPEVGLSGAPVTATPKRRCRTHPCSWRGQLLVVLLGCSPYCRALVRALAHVTGALTAVIRCPDGSRHGQTGGVAWRRGGVYDSLPQHRRAARMSFSPLRAPAAASPTSGQVDTTPDHRGFVPARGCPRLAGLAGRGRQGSRVFLGVIARLVVGEWGRRCGCPTAAGGFAPGPRSR